MRSRVPVREPFGGVGILGEVPIFFSVSEFMSIEFARYVVAQLVEAGFIAYWAGGCVRDLLRGVAPHDYDVATNATPAEVRKVFGRNRSLPVGESFGVVIVIGEKGSGDSIEVATFRREGEYRDGRRPSSVEFCSAKEDAYRRDLTINGMFFDPLKEEVHDFVGGMQDLERRVVRAIGVAQQRFEEDKLRLLRAVRFAAALDFELESGTADAIANMAQSVLVVSAERIAQEFRKMLADRNRGRAMQMCADLGLLAVILPELTESTLAPESARWKQRLQHLQALGESSFVDSFAVLLLDVPDGEDRSPRNPETHGTVSRICRRLRLSNDESDQIRWLVRQYGQIAKLRDSTLAEVKRLAAHPQIANLLKIERAAAEIESSDLFPYEWVDNFLNSTPREVIDPPPLISGDDLIANGIKSGPRFKSWLWQVRDAQLNLTIQTKAEALEMVKRLASQDVGR